jgi:hypothetical protein
MAAFLVRAYGLSGGSSDLFVDDNGLIFEGSIDILGSTGVSNPPGSGTVWTTQRGGYLRRGSFGRIWRKAVAESVGPPCRVHDLRHTHTAWLIADGEHPKAIQTRLGHGSIAVTMDSYGHLMDGLDDQIASHLDARAEAAAPPARPKPSPGDTAVDLQIRRIP